MEGRRCKRAAIYWFITPKLTRMHACDKHMREWVRKAQMNGVAAVFGRMEPGEGETCGKITTGGREHETTVEGDSKRDFGKDGLGSNLCRDNMGRS